MTELALDVSRETTERLRRLTHLVRKWSPRINLVASSQLADLWERHISDSAQLFAHAPKNPRRWVDLGSGGGFPGLVISVLAAAREWSTEFVLVESDQRKATFLRSAAREVGVTPTVLASRSEELASLSADVLSARALAPLDQLLAHVVRHLAPGGVAILPKGAGHDAEIREARLTWGFACERFPSITDQNAAILRLREISRA